jgi:hypothetical protein
MTEKNVLIPVNKFILTAGNDYIGVAPDGYPYKTNIFQARRFETFKDLTEYDSHFQSENYGGILVKTIQLSFNWVTDDMKKAHQMEIDYQQELAALNKKYGKA